MKLKDIWNMDQPWPIPYTLESLQYCIQKFLSEYGDWEMVEPVEGGCCKCGERWAGSHECEQPDRYRGFAEPPPWGELNSKLECYCSVGQKAEYLEDEELRWKEIERRVKKMIAAERTRLVRALRCSAMAVAAHGIGHALADELERRDESDRQN